MKKPIKPGKEPEKPVRTFTRQKRHEIQVWDGLLIDLLNQVPEAHRSIARIELRYDYENTEVYVIWDVDEIITLTDKEWTATLAKYDEKITKWQAKKRQYDLDVADLIASNLDTEARERELLAKLQAKYPSL